MSDLAHLKIWNDPAIRDSLSWYLDVAENRRPAKFRIAATVVTQTDPAASSEDTLWAELERLTPVFLGHWRAIRAGAQLPATTEGPSLLELCRELAYRMLAHCNFCPWDCHRRQARSLQARLRRTGEHAFPSHRRGAVLSRHGWIRDDLFHFLQHAMRLLSERRHQHRQGQRRGGRCARRPGP